jgi:hypothetical protein
MVIKMKRLIRKRIQVVPEHPLQPFKCRILGFDEGDYFFDHDSDEFIGKIFKVTRLSSWRKHENYCEGHFFPTFPKSPRMTEIFLNESARGIYLVGAKVQFLGYV